MNTITKIGLAVLAFTALLGVLVFATAEEEPQPPNFETWETPAPTPSATPEPTPTTEPTPIPTQAVDEELTPRQIFEEAFIEGCMEEDADRSYCVCTWNYLDTMYTIDEMLELGIDEITDAAEVCTLLTE
mgnify:CR=1 FL=1